MLSVSKSPSVNILPERLEMVGRGYPTNAPDRSDGQKLVISQSGHVLGCYESLLNDIRPYPNTAPERAVQALVEITTRLSQATMPGMTAPATTGPNNFSGGDLSQERVEKLKNVALSGIKVIGDHIAHKVSDDDPVKAEIAASAQALTQKIEAVIAQPDSEVGSGSLSSMGSDCLEAQEEASEKAVQIEFDIKNMLSLESQDNSGKSVSTDMPITSSDTQRNTDLFEQLRHFVRTAKPYFVDEGDRLTGIFGRIACDLHNLLFKGASAKSINDRKQALRSAVMFVTYDFLLHAKVPHHHQQRVLGDAQRLLDAIDTLLKKPELKLGGKSAASRKGAIGWLRGLVN